MGLFDNNIHLNGAGTSYQSFLQLADEAEQKGGKIGDRTVRLVRAGDGLATTTFSGTKGERATQIGSARKAFLDAIAKEFGYAARNIAEKTLGAADGEPVPLTARTIRAVNRALGDTGALAADSALVREFKTDFDLEVAGAELSLGSRMGGNGCKLDRGRIQAEALRLIGEGKFTNDKDGLRNAVRSAVAPRAIAAMQMEALLRAQGIPPHLVQRLAEPVLDEAAAVLDDFTIPGGAAVAARLDALVEKCLINGKAIFARDALAAAAVSDAQNLLTTMFGDNAFEDGDFRDALDSFKSDLENLKDKNLAPDAFKAACDKALSYHVKTFAIRQIGIQMMMENSKSPAYGRFGARLYDAFGASKAKDARKVSDFTMWKIKPSDITTRFDLDDKGPDGLRKIASKIVFQSVAADCAAKFPSPPGAHPELATARESIALTTASDLLARFETAVTDEDFAKLAEDYRTQFGQRLADVDASLKNIDQAQDRAKAELEERLADLAAQNGVEITQGIRGMLSKTLSEAVEKIQKDALTAGKALSADECKAALLDRVDAKWLEPCRQAAAEIGSSALDPAQKKAFLARAMAHTIDLAHIRMALRTAPSFDAGALVAAAKEGNGAKLAEELFRFVFETNAAITDADERKAIHGSEEYSSFMSMATDLLFSLHPDIAGGVRGLEAAARDRLFDEAGTLTTDKSREIQQQRRDGLDLAQAQALALGAKHWSSANACLLQLQHELQA